MMQICQRDKCTGCGMCSNICPKNAITMAEGEHSFIFPQIDENLCVECGLCQSSCPSNIIHDKTKSIKKVYAAWNKNKYVRKKSTSGGVFTLLAEAILKQDGLVCGVAWDESHLPRHIIIKDFHDIDLLNGSKYSQSITGCIYSKVKEALDRNITVLFSGTPCQNSALSNFLGKEYSNLYQLDLICHGVPSNIMLEKYYSSFRKEIKAVNLRYKDPYWDYTFVKIDFNDGSFYKNLTIDDDYFNLFNIGYSIRNSCQSCRYTNTYRMGDITLADFWGFKAHSFKTIDYNKGTSCILINSEKGQKLFDLVNKNLYFEESTIEKAIAGNKCLKEPFKVDEDKKKHFWDDYESGLSVHELCAKYCERRFNLPNHLNIRRFANQFRWIFKI